MKKSIFCILTILIMLSFGGLTTVHAAPYIEVEGFVDPTAATTIVDNGVTTTFSEVFYHFNVITADLGSMMDFISLEFEGDVFSSVGSLAFNSPTDWNSSTITSSSGNLYQLLSAGTALGQGHQFMVTVSDVAVYNEALTGDALWQEGQMWGQSWLAGDTFGGRDGGSTSLASIPVVPEPISSTLFLVGGGLLAFRRFRRA